MAIFGWLMYFMLAHIIADAFGRHRKIGYGKSVFWCVLLTPIIGVLIVLSSKELKSA